MNQQLSPEAAAVRLEQALDKRESCLQFLKQNAVAMLRQGRTHEQALIATTVSSSVQIAHLRQRNNDLEHFVHVIGMVAIQQVLDCLGDLYLKHRTLKDVKPRALYLLKAYGYVKDESEER